MKIIKSACVHPTNTENEYTWTESNIMEHGHEWNGDVKGYVENLLPDDLCIVEHYEGAIHNEPAGMVVVAEEEGGKPREIYWAEEPTDADLCAYIRNYDIWVPALCRELCDRAGLLEEYEAADSDEFEAVCQRAAEILGYEII